MAKTKPRERYRLRVNYELPHVRVSVLLESCVLTGKITVEIWEIYPKDVTAYTMGDFLNRKLKRFRNLEKAKQYFFEMSSLAYGRAEQLQSEYLVRVAAKGATLKERGTAI